MPNAYSKKSVAECTDTLMQILKDGRPRTTAELDAQTGHKYNLNLIRCALAEGRKRGEILISYRSRVILYSFNFDIGISTKTRLYEYIRQTAGTFNRGASKRRLSIALGVSERQIYPLLCELYHEGKIVRTRPEPDLIVYWPSSAGIPEKDQVPMREDGEYENRYQFLTKPELFNAKRRVMIGDVLPCMVKHSDDGKEEPEIKRLPVMEKSRHLITMTDGSTYSYADLAMHYRDCGPLGRWS